MRKHIIVYYFLKGFLGFSSLLVVLFIMNFGGQSIYGKFSLILSLIMIINNGFGGWINQIILRFYDCKKSIADFFSFVLKIALFSLLMGIAVLVFILLRFNLNIDLILPIIVFIGVFLNSILLTFYQKALESLKVLYFEVIRVVTLWIFLFILIFLRGKLLTEYLFIGLAISYMVSVVIQLRFHVSDINLIKIDSLCMRGKFVDYIKFGLSIGLWLFLASLLNLVDRYIINYFYSYQVVGIYSSVYDIVYKISTLFLSPILLAAHPIIMNEYSAGTDKYKMIIKKAMVLELKVLPILLVIIGGISFFSRDLLQIRQVEFIILSFPILIGAFLWNFAMILHKFLEVMGDMYSMLRFIIFSLIFNILLNLILIPLYGFESAAYITFLSFGLYNLMVWFKLRKLEVL